MDWGGGSAKEKKDGQKRQDRESGVEGDKVQRSGQLRRRFFSKRERNKKMPKASGMLATQGVLIEDKRSNYYGRTTTLRQTEGRGSKTAGAQKKKRKGKGSREGLERKIHTSRWDSRVKRGTEDSKHEKSVREGARGEYRGRRSIRGKVDALKRNGMHKN